MGDAGGELAERSELFGLHQAILRGAQFVERQRQLLGALLHLVEQTHVLDGDDGLVGKGLHQIDLALAEWSGRPAFPAAARLRPRRRASAAPRAPPGNRRSSAPRQNYIRGRLARPRRGPAWPSMKDPAGDGLAARPDRVGMHEIDEGRRAAGFGLQPHHLAVAQEDDRRAMRRTATLRTRSASSSTDFRSNAERLMTFSTSAVAVCCCKRFAQLGRALLDLVLEVGIGFLQAARPCR